MTGVSQVGVAPEPLSADRRGCSAGAPGGGSLDGHREASPTPPAGWWAPASMIRCRARLAESRWVPPDRRHGAEIVESQPITCGIRRSTSLAHGRRARRSPAAVQRRARTSARATSASPRISRSPSDAPPGGAECCAPELRIDLTGELLGDGVLRNDTRRDHPDEEVAGSSVELR